LLDEAFSAGDQNFHERCHAFFEAESRRETTYVIATHNPTALNYFCNEAIWLDKGCIVAFGPIDDVIRDYTASKRS
jgi:ABC-type polysaccharide/polyol phosphate transport system ATPase subunit